MHVRTYRYSSGRSSLTFNKRRKSLQEMERNAASRNTASRNTASRNAASRNAASRNTGPRTSAQSYDHTDKKSPEWFPVNIHAQTRKIRNRYSVNSFIAIFLSVHSLFYLSIYSSICCLSAYISVLAPKVAQIPFCLLNLKLKLTFSREYSDVIVRNSLLS